MARKASKGGKLNAINAGSNKISGSVKRGAARMKGKSSAIIKTGKKKSGLATAKGSASFLDKKGGTKSSQKKMAKTAAKQANGPTSGKGKRGWRPKGAK